VEWIVRDILPKRSLVFLVGPSGHGKSFVAMDMSLSVAAGTRWLGQWECRKGNVFYAVAEGQAGLKKRWRAWARHHGLPLPGNLRLLPYPYFCQRPEELDELRRNIDETGLRPDLIVLDTFNQMFLGNEKEGADVRAFMAALNHLRLDYDCTVQVLHHTGWAENRRERGHSSMRGDVDATWIVYKPNGDEAPVTDGIVMENPKMREAENRPPFMICARTVGTGDEKSVVLTGMMPYGDMLARQEHDAKIRRLSPVLKRLSQTEPRSTADLMPVNGMDEKTVLRQLKEAAELGLAIQGGKGIRHSPFVFLLSDAGQQVV